VNLAVEMFGLSPHTEANLVNVEVENGATIGQLLEELGRKVPKLRGRVIQPDNRLVENYGLYINGEFVSDDAAVRIKQGDRVVLILLATGG
jgi:molybdopterin converting factor small subunit